MSLLNNLASAATSNYTISTNVNYSKNHTFSMSCSEGNYQSSTVCDSKLLNDKVICSFSQRGIQLRNLCFMVCSNWHIIQLYLGGRTLICGTGKPCEQCGGSPIQICERLKHNQFFYYRLKNLDLDNTRKIIAFYQELIKSLPTTEVSKQKFFYYYKDGEEFSLHIDEVNSQLIRNLRGKTLERLVVGSESLNDFDVQTLRYTNNKPIIKKLVIKERADNLHKVINKDQVTSVKGLDNCKWQFLEECLTNYPNLRTLKCNVTIPSHFRDTRLRKLHCRHIEVPKSSVEIIHNQIMGTDILGRFPNLKQFKIERGGILKYLKGVRKVDEVIINNGFYAPKGKFKKLVFKYSDGRTVINLDEIRCSFDNLQLKNSNSIYQLNIKPTDNYTVPNFISLMEYNIIQQSIKDKYTD